MVHKDIHSKQFLVENETQDVLQIIVSYAQRMAKALSLRESPAKQTLRTGRYRAPSCPAGALQPAAQQQPKKVASNATHATHATPGGENATAVL